MDWSKYTDYLDHFHPAASVDVEIVAYHRRAGGYNVYVQEPVGSPPPEFEAARVDDDRVFVTTIDIGDTSANLDDVANGIQNRLGPDYECAVYYRETGSRRVIGKIDSYLSSRGARHMSVHSDGHENWELVKERLSHRRRNHPFKRLNLKVRYE